MKGLDIVGKRERDPEGVGKSAGEKSLISGILKSFGWGFRQTRTMECFLSISKFDQDT